MTIPIRDFKADRMRELFCVVHPPLSDLGAKERRVILLDALDKDFALDMSRDDAINLMTLLEMYAERL